MDPAELKVQVELRQQPIAAIAMARSVEGVVRSELAYVSVPVEAGPFLVPFGGYDEWSPRDRYNQRFGS